MVFPLPDPSARQTHFVTSHARYQAYVHPGALGAGKGKTMTDIPASYDRPSVAKIL